MITFQTHNFIKEYIEYLLELTLSTRAPGTIITWAGSGGITVTDDIQAEFKKAGIPYDPNMFSTKNIWHHLEKYCGYNSDQFKEHMEKEFKP